MNLPSEVRFIRRDWLNSNSVLICGDDGPIIVDTGHVAKVDETLALIRAVGVDPATIRLIATTHCHCDHHGGNATLKALSGAPIAMSAGTADLFARNDRRAIWLDYFGQEATLVPADVIWRDGAVVTLGGMRFEIIATPGHAPDAISLYQRDTRLLICADALWKNDCGVINVVVHGDAALDAAEATVQRLLRYDVAVALPGHGDLIADVAENLRAVARRLARFRREPEQLAWHLVRRVTLFNVLRMGPVSRADLAAFILRWPWLHDYAPLCGYTTAERLLRDVVDDFVARDLVRESKGMLTSTL